MSEDGAHEPLIRPVSPRPEDAEEDAYNTAERDRQDEERGFDVPGIFIWVLTFCAGVSGLLFGYDTGVISSTLVSIDSSLSRRALTILDKSLITSSTSLFALLISPISGLLADGLGRKKVILLADALFVLGALWQALSTTVWGMILGRSVIGLAVGSASFVTPLYISEIAPAQWRGRLVTVSSLFITGGQVVAYLIGWAFSQVNGGWRWMVGLGAVPAILQLLALLFMPETPRWLVKAGKQEKAREVLTKVYGLNEERVVESILKSISDEIEEESSARKISSINDTTTPSPLRRQFRAFKYTIRELCTVGGNRRALVISCMLQASQQLCGFNSLMYFSATIFAMVGFKNPIATSLTVALTNFVFTLGTFTFIDRLGRRRILLGSIPIMVLGLTICAIAFNFVHIPEHAIKPRAIPGLHLARITATKSSSAGPWPLTIVASMILYVAAYALGLGCVPWQQSELFPLSVRSMGSSLATATNWASNTVVGLTFLPMMEAVTPMGTFATYAVVCFLSWIAVYSIYPETAGLGMEGVGALLKDDFGVKESLVGFRERKVRRREREGRRRDGGTQ
ncbi:Mediator of RNA polymerase II transcription subunit 5 [Venturia inaequalis]|nr:Mediator of RNA polymerase II transcription subunit 5 [Venturia inaequalis]